MSQLFEVPSVCPVCSSSLSIEGDFLYCRSKSCPAKLSGSIRVWIDRLGILQWGDSLIESLTDSGAVSTLADIYRLSVDDLANCCSGKKVAKKCWDILHANKTVTLELLLSALNIQNLGVSTATDIVQFGYDTIDKIISMSVDDLMRVPNIGEITARQIYDGVQEKREVIFQLATVLEIKKPTAGPLYGMSFCITGATSKPRKLVQKEIMDAGGVVKSSVGSGLTYLVTNESVEFGSSKMVKAEKLGIKVITEIRLYEMINLK